jgi:hypothetical protein
MKKLSREQEVTISETIESAIDEIFTDLHQEFGTRSGDITPEQDFELEIIKLQLSKLISTQINQNL